MTDFIAIANVDAVSHATALRPGRAWERPVVDRIRWKRPFGLPRWAVGVLGGLLLGQAVLRGFLAHRGYFYGDDFDLLFKAQVAGPVIDGLQYSGHTMPLPLAVSGWFGRTFHANWEVAAVLLVLGQVAASLAVIRALVVLAAPSAAAVVAGAAVYLASPFTVASSTWVSAALNSLPLHAALATAVAESVAFVRTRRRRHAVVALGALAFGLACSEKALIIVPAAVGAALLFLTVRGGRGAVRRAVRSGRFLWAGFAGMAAIWGAVVVATTDYPAEFPAGRRFGQTVDGLVHAFAHTVVPGVAGGPWRWVRMGTAVPWVEVTRPQFLAGVAVALIVGAVTVWLVRRGWLLWAAALIVYPVLSLAPVYWSRAGETTTVLFALSNRAQSDIAVVWALLVAIGVGAYARGRRGRTGRARVRDGVAGSAVVLLVAVSMVGGAVSTVQFSRIWDLDPTGDYAARLEATLASARGSGGVLLDQRIDSEMLRTAPDLETGLRGLYGDGAPRVARSTDYANLATIGTDGALVQAGLEVAAPAFVTSTTLAGTTTIELPQPLFDWQWVVVLTTHLTRPADITAELESGTPTTVSVPAGRSQSTAFLIEGGGSELRLTTTSPAPIGTLMSAMVGKVRDGRG
ncbi:hypothetical protein GCM10009551_098810 [Nocardiopsis tropica]